jgi:hypothetical protein
MHYVLGPAGLLILFWIRKNCHSSGRNLLYLFIRRVTKLVIVEGYKCYQPCTKSIQYSCLKVNSTCRQNYMVSVWISTKYIKYWTDILYSSDTGQKVVV